MAESTIQNRVATGRTKNLVKTTTTNNPATAKPHATTTSKTTTTTPPQKMNRKLLTSTSTRGPFNISSKRHHVTAPPLPPGPSISIRLDSLIDELYYSTNRLVGESPSEIIAGVKEIASKHMGARVAAANIKDVCFALRYNAFSLDAPRPVLCVVASWLSDDVSRGQWEETVEEVKRFLDLDVLDDSVVGGDGDDGVGITVEMVAPQCLGAFMEFEGGLPRDEVLGGGVVDWARVKELVGEQFQAQFAEKEKKEREEREAKEKKENEEREWLERLRVMREEKEKKEMEERERMRREKREQEEREEKEERERKAAELREAELRVALQAFGVDDGVEELANALSGLSLTNIG